ncbi:GNAT family N-acetyltransferase [Nguyenibacter vanlangensis]|uniref:GNAT family N-acetyltransferase n=1 Tax=Nguyenibacter vanlangensis TaxID=1216886 RepID=A0A7Y7IU60_9PROT|nr:GNAT family N-acetyltransferase [Nguyenibacter vanlangensis]NVN10454.1 GNAT family N-acetyltransferase [Nguyenibacter vanlangensis]
MAGRVDDANIGDNTSMGERDVGQAGTLVSDMFGQGQSIDNSLLGCRSPIDHTLSMLPESLRTTRHALRPISRGDAEEIFHGYAQDSEVSRYTMWTPHKNLTETEKFVDGCLATSPDLARTYAICDQAGGFRGLFGLRHVKPYHIEFGYVLAHRWWRQGIMTEVLTEAVNALLAQDTCFRISGVCDVDNIGSARVMEKAGLLREGVLRRWIIHPNISSQPRDCLLYAKVK